ncbi:MAG: flavin-nucleotide-binding protein [Candidatus Lokiarchaeota archaeon]|nr:flavin-nucleotide-binding protein [Candidatus Lokiarchaeota archaeon]MBD3201470.1 flavin-nucleotide-binding protein [Candidatus Lokiarchaeota archaeon]
MLKPHMQKEEKQITDSRILNEILKTGKYAHISLCDENVPYIITLSYGYDVSTNCLYFHTAKKGYKLEFIKNNPQACGTVVEDLGYQSGKCDHHYRSVVFWGEINIIKPMKEQKYAFDILLNHLDENPKKSKSRFLNTKSKYENTCILKFEIEEITGKGSE